MLESNKIYLGDCLELMQQIDDKSIDMICCDLPYGLSKGNDSERVAWDASIIPLDKLWAQYKRIIKDNGCIALTATMAFAVKLISSNTKMFRYDLVWHKSMKTGFGNANRMPMRQHENILIFYRKLPVYNPQFSFGHSKEERKGGQRISGICVAPGSPLAYRTPYINTDGKRYHGSVIKVSNGNYNGMHPTQKPVELMEWLIKTYTNEGDLVLDNCAGSGTTGIAALNTNRKFILMEQEEEYLEASKKRLETWPLMERKKKKPAIIETQLELFG